MPSVPLPRRRERPPATPEDLYERLNVTDSAIGGMWRHQSHVLRGYYEEHADSNDIALELPTGAGKTLVGMLIADWRRRTTDDVTAFLCPTVQLAEQAASKAVGYGIPAVCLTGPGARWIPAEETRGQTGKAVIVSTYSHVFNTNPRLAPGTLVLDDAHAAENYVIGNWSVSVPREHPAFKAVLALVGEGLAPEHKADLFDDDLGPAHRPGTQLVSPTVLRSQADALVASLDERLDDQEPASYSLSQIRGHIAGCLMFVGWSEFLIRPFVSPTRFHDAFEAADQRVYLSATLGAAGELERAFGRTKIPRLAMPSDWERHGSGRRLVLGRRPA